MAQMTPQRYIRWIIPCIYVMSLVACGGFLFEEQDAAPILQVDISKIPDAKPRTEPFSKYGNPSSYEVFGKVYTVLPDNKDYEAQGIASWYGTKFHGRRTSSGEPYDMYAMTAAHKTLPLPTYAEVTNLDNGRKIVVKINDRGPFHDDRLIDLSYVAAIKLGITGSGTGRVEVRSITPGVTTTPGQGPAAEKGVMFLQVGTFSMKENAEKMLQRLKQASIENLHLSQHVANEATIFKVRIGPVSDRAEADRISNQLVSLGITNPFIIVD